VKKLAEKKYQFYNGYMNGFLAHILKHVEDSRKGEHPIDVVVNNLYCIVKCEDEFSFIYILAFPLHGPL
jgi:hypothetical protein